MKKFLVLLSLVLFFTACASPPTPSADTGRPIPTPSPTVTLPAGVPTLMATQPANTPVPPEKWEASAWLKIGESVKFAIDGTKRDEIVFTLVDVAYNSDMVPIVEYEVISSINDGCATHGEKWNESVNPTARYCLDDRYVDTFNDEDSKRYWVGSKLWLEVSNPDSDGLRVTLHVDEAHVSVVGIFP